jgi:hypothetical protein
MTIRFDDVQMEKYVVTKSIFSDTEEWNYGSTIYYFFCGISLSDKPHTNLQVYSASEDPIYICALIYAFRNLLLCHLISAKKKKKKKTATASVNAIN